MHLDLVKPRARLIGRRPLDALVIFPLTNALRGSAARPLLPFTRSRLSGKLRVRRRRRSAGNLRHTRVRVMLVGRPRESATRGRRRVVDNRPDFGARTRWAVEAWYWSVARRWLNAVRRGRRRCTTLAEKRWWTLTRKLLLGRRLGRTLRCSERRVLRWEVCRRWLIRSGLLVLRRRR